MRHGLMLWILTAAALCRPGGARAGGSAPERGAPPRQDRGGDAACLLQGGWAVGEGQPWQRGQSPSLTTSRAPRPHTFPPLAAPARKPKAVAGGPPPGWGMPLPGWRGLPPGWVPMQSVAGNEEVQDEVAPVLLPGADVGMADLGADLPKRRPPKKPAQLPSTSKAPSRQILETPEDEWVSEARMESTEMQGYNKALETSIVKLHDDIASFEAQLLTDNNEFSGLNRQHRSAVASVQKKNKTLTEKLGLYAELQKMNHQLSANVAYRQKVAELEKKLASDTLVPRIKAAKDKLAALKGEVDEAKTEIDQKKGKVVNVLAELAAHKEAAGKDGPEAWAGEKAALEGEAQQLEGWLDSNRTLSKTIHDQLGATTSQFGKTKALTDRLKYKLAGMPKTDAYDSPPQFGNNTKESLLAKLAILAPLVAQWDTIHGLEHELENTTLLAAKLDYETQTHLSRARKSRARLEAKARTLQKQIGDLQGSMSSIREGLGDIVSR